jgi:aminoglycoside phosphotransferase (APT) family kinase protein
MAVDSAGKRAVADDDCRLADSAQLAVNNRADDLITAGTGTGDGTVALLAWAARAMQGRLVAHSRLPTVRPAWRVDLQGPRDGTAPFVIRCARPAGFGLSATYSLEREARILEALGRCGIPVPAVRAQSSELQALLLDCLPGRSDFEVLDADAAWKERVVDQFLAWLAKWHAIPLESLALDDVLPRPERPTAHALQELDVWSDLYRNAARTEDPLLDFSLGWLRRNAPRSPETVLVQGDTGPNQCLFDERGIVAVLDWELAHFGDPMEDLGWIAARSFFAKYGELPTLLRRYSQLSGRPLDYTRIGYYRVMALVKCAIATGLAREAMGPADDIGSILCWDTINRYSLAWSLAHSAGHAVPAELPASRAACEPLHGTVSEALCALALSQQNPFEALRVQGLGECVALLGLGDEPNADDARAERWPTPARGGPGASDAELIAYFHEQERVGMQRLQRTFGRRGRVNLEPLE